MNVVQLSLAQAIIASLLTALVIFAERAFPFVLFSKKEPPALIRFIEKYIPPMVMAALVVYSLKDVSLTSVRMSIPYGLGIIVAAVTYKWKHNPLISIFGGTILFMILSRI